MGQTKIKYYRILDFTLRAAEYLRCLECGQPSYADVHAGRRGSKESGQHVYTGRGTKLSYALERTRSNIDKARISHKYEEKLEDLRREHALTDPPDSADGKLVEMPPDPNGAVRYAYSKTGRKKLIEAISKLNEEEFEMELYQCKGGIPKSLTESQLDAFAGFVFTQEQIDEFRAQREASLVDDDEGISNSNGQLEVTESEPVAEIAN